ncbi:ATP-dependent DNA helicase [Mesorhizobium hungaricum]|uniref:DNA 3'-5' helicase n=1 Tax=Mesorhizobium hungaricum TaxID=1566387 RepID=A0A1C2E7D0_9HYPH|nr:MULTISPECIES: ATP-dependent helicase [Mesorhizobium]MBN9237389.1 ATP-dependent helicase [Mesorhizobium sp.]MDQ0333317.1 DNA helicase-2/ATP-dependent DNA helicase PcrA [Mesorhizobium sp. YL-MeA3-2017]OCX22907.1 ATP-dependent DNA helicase [Mesorhizobium hungaricum]
MNLAVLDSTVAAAAPDDYLAGLNTEQRSAVVHGEGSAAEPLLIIAGAGSGKTNTLAHRVAHLIVNGADPRRILLMTFSRRAAAEMTRRVERIAAMVLGDKASIMTEGLTWAGTFHAIGARLLRDHALEIGLDPAFTIHDREDSADLMNLVRHELGLSKTESRFPAKGTCLAIYSRAVNAQAELEAVLAKSFPWCIGWAEELKTLFGAYVEAKQAQNVLDYDDLLLWWAQMCAEPAIVEQLRSRFDHILVDEYQDTNRLQATILTALKPDGRGLTVVGDDAQSIYSFRAAEVRNILDFPGLFPEPARIVTLDRNYRSTNTVLDAANAVIGEAADRFIKNLWTERRSAEKPLLVTVRDDAEQANYVCDKVLEERESGTRLRAQAVLFRASHHSGPLEVELTRRNIPFVKFGGLKFLDSAHVKDVLALLRFAENPRDRVAGFRVLQLLPGIGPSAAGAAIEAMERALDPVLGLQFFKVPARADEDWPPFVDLFSALRTRSTWPADLERVRLWYEPHLERVHEDAAARRADLLQLEQIAAGYPSRERFLTDLTLDPPDATSGDAGPPHLDEDYLILSTIHSAKGQEWTKVFLLNTVDGCIPIDLAVGERDDLEEERRLLYVAMTRAKDSLHLVTPQRFYVSGQSAWGDRHVYASRTRFIPDHILDRFEQISWPPPSAAPGRAPQPEVRIDLKTKMRGMWR